jgi:multidrug efflux pump subunit AcrA (membrane-fusion protein)
MLRLTRAMSSPGAGAVALSLAFALAGCGGRAAQKAPPPPYVATEVATQGTIAPYEMLPGIVAPYQNVAIQSTLTEPADAVNVQEGDPVHKGELLAQLDTADLVAALNNDLATAESAKANTTHSTYQGSLSIDQGVDSLRSAQTAVKQADETLARDTIDLGRDRQLVVQGYVAEQTYRDQITTVRNDQQAAKAARAALSSAQSNVTANGTLGSNGLQASSIEQARAQEQAALAEAQQERVQIAKASIYSPIDGVVVNRNFNQGEYPGSRQLFTLQQIDPIFAILRGSGAQVARISNGAKAIVIASDLEGQKLTGTVVGVLNQIAPGSTDFQVKVLLQNHNDRLRPGMAVIGHLELPVARGVLVPATAFTDDNHTQLLTVAQDGTVHTVAVREIADDNTHSVVSGIPAGTRVIRDGQTSVGDGQKVAIR